MIIKDQTQRQIEIKEIPKRIISIVPSQTEYLFDLGLENEVVGITKFCIYPKKWFKGKTKVGGTKKLNIDKIKNLSPDFIIGNKEENTKEDILELEKICPVWLSEIYNLDDAYSMMRSLGEILGKVKESQNILSKIQNEFKELENFIEIESIKRNVAYVIWKDPYMVAANNTFIHQILTLAGFTNHFALKERYPKVELKDFENCKFIFLSSEPYPFQKKHLLEFKKSFPESTILIVNGEMFSWYGSRLIKTPTYLIKLLKNCKN
jgi:ABC-type Fe3+-hydroxamate transport system substrate-binding protein